MVDYTKWEPLILEAMSPYIPLGVSEGTLRREAERLVRRARATFGDEDADGMRAVLLKGVGRCARQLLYLHIPEQRVYLVELVKSRWQVLNLELGRAPDIVELYEATDIYLRDLQQLVTELGLPQHIPGEK